MYELPPYAEPLSIPGFHAHWEAGQHWQEQRSLTFFLLEQKPEHPARIGSYRVAEIVFPATPTWRVPRADELRYLIQPSGGQNFKPDQIRAVTEVLTIAADVCDVLATTVQHKIAAIEKAREAERLEYERRQRERDAERQRALAERQAARARETQREAHLYELMKWHLEDRIKCRRDGFKQNSHPQGTINSVDERGMNITTEKGKPMRIDFKLVNCMWLKDVDSPRSYDVIYTAGDEVKEEVTSDDSND